ncbi:hypothetical protein [Halomonas sp. PA16-9]|uniref:hypothetical protein n=1 Tax=Halomonas sp. PA16-9 TaxID=2576841 RepID=UPI003FA57FDE
MNIGQELDNTHAPYRSFTADDGDLDYYFRWSPQLLDLVKSQLALTGGMGISAALVTGLFRVNHGLYRCTRRSGSAHRLFAKAGERGHPLRQLSSFFGLHSIEDKRYVFHWNNDKVPNPTTLTKAFNDSGCD